MSRKASTPVGKITSRQILSAVKMYMKVKEDLDADPSIIAAGMNCLNKSMYQRYHPLPGLEPVVRRPANGLGLRRRSGLDADRGIDREDHRRALHDDQSLPVRDGAGRLETRAYSEFPRGGWRSQRTTSWPPIAVTWVWCRKLSQPSGPCAIRCWRS